MYSLDREAIGTHVPSHPERTIFGGRNPFFVYYREFSTRAAMQRWLNHQSWEERQLWHVWMASKTNRALLNKQTAMQAMLAIQPSLFV
jgi:hypothetical protein